MTYALVHKAMPQNFLLVAGEMARSARCTVYVYRDMIGDQRIPYRLTTDPHDVVLAVKSGWEAVGCVDMDGEVTCG